MPLTTPMTREPLVRLLYVSMLAPKVPVTEVSRIVVVSRLRNANDAITGLLVFDGAAFCQYLEGPAAAVDALLDRLSNDPRHCDMQVLVHGAAPATRRFSDWRLGYVDSFEADEIGILRGLRGCEALEQFEKVLPQLDVEA